MPNLSGVTGLTLLLRKSSDYSAVNGAGDSLTESGTTGWFTATVAESWAETLSATVIDSGGLIPFGGWLGVGATIVSDTTALAADDAILAAIAALNNLSAAQVNAELLDVLNTDTFAELSAPPAANSTLAAKLTWLFMWARNKATETATQRKLYADNNTTVVSTETVGDDGTTFTKAKAS